MTKQEKLLLKQAMRFLVADKRPRAIRKILKAVARDEVTWQECTFEVYPGDNYSDRIFWLNERPDELRTITALLNIVRGQDTLFFDVGSNTGIFSVLVARHTSDRSEIRAFDPHPEMLKRFNRNVELNDLSARISVEQCALSEDDGTAELRVFASNYGRSTLRDDDPKEAMEVLTVPTRKITDFVPVAAQDRLCVLKIDVEGFEDRVMRPLLDDDKKLAWFDHVILEVVHKESWQYDLVGELEAKGFRAGKLMEGNLLLSRVDGSEGVTG